MAKADGWFETSATRWFLRMFGAFPIVRGRADQWALDYSLLVLEKGAILCIFPEGEVSVEARMRKAKTGAANLALQSGAPVVPVGIAGAEGFRSAGVLLRREIQVKVRVGHPIEIPVQPEPNRSQLVRWTEIIMCAIARLLPEEYRGAYSSC
jgi:1-acyl-sn-glycerol-3-phosphate acyltransferase